MRKKYLAVFLCLLLVFMKISLSFAEDATPTAAPTAAPAEAEEELPRGYVLVTTSTMQGWLPLPLTEDYTYPLRQTSDEGIEVVNVIHLMPDGMYMESADCDNQQCVGEGVVTFENRDSRILGNAIYCLPHQVVLELYSLEEIMELYGVETGENP